MMLLYLLQSMEGGGERKEGGFFFSGWVITITNNE